MITTILWDVDGTLINFKAAEKNALRAAFAKFGYGSCDDDMVARYSEFNEACWKRLEREQADKAVFLVERFVDFLGAEGLPTDDAGAFNHYYQMQLGETIVFNDDSYELVKSLRGSVLQYAVTNGTMTAQSNKLAKSGLDQLFDGIFISEMTGYDKPADGFFEYVFERIVDCGRDQIMIVGDSLTSDMAGGLRQGIVTAWYNPEAEPLPDGMDIDYDLRSLQEVRAIVAAP